VELNGSGRVKPLENLGNIPERVVADKLAGNLTVRCNANQHSAAIAVEEGAERLDCTNQLAGGFLELD
jgi:hypothetical protein